MLHWKWRIFLPNGFNVLCVQSSKRWLKNRTKQYYLTYLMYEFHSNIIIKVHLNGDFMRKKNLLLALGFEPITFHIMSSFLSIIFFPLWSLCLYWWRILWWTSELPLKQLIWLSATSPRACTSSNKLYVLVLHLQPCIARTTSNIILTLVQTSRTPLSCWSTKYFFLASAVTDPYFA